MMKGTPFAYNRDFQEDKIPLFDAMKQVKLGIEGVRDMVNGIQIFPENTLRSLKSGFSTATDLADWLVAEKKIPFRTSHEITGELVRVCQERGWDLFSIPASEREKVHMALIDPGYAAAINLETSCDKKNVQGGTAKPRQWEQIKVAKSKLKELSKMIKIKKGK